MASPRRTMTVFSYLIALTALALALGYLDAVSRFYLRGTLEVAQEGGDFARAAVERMPDRVVALEQTRHAALVLTIIAVAVIAGRNGLQRGGTFCFALGAWGVLRYAALRGIVNWPTTLLDADAVLLLPRMVYAPVWMAIVVGLALAAAGVALIRAGALALRRERR